MAEKLLNDCLPSEIGDSDRYNRLEICRATQMRDDSTADTPIDTAAELLRVLIVDDDHDAVDTMSMLVDAWGHDVRRAYNGAIGLAVAAAYQPDVLLLDVVMPRMSGPELARQVRQLVRLNDCFIVAVTGRSDAQHRKQCQEAGIDLYVIKPVNPTMLQSLLAWRSACILRARKVPETYGGRSPSLQDISSPKSHKTV